MATTKKATEKRSGTKAKRQRSLRYTGPTPWKTWKKGQRWSLEPTAAEVAYYRKTIAEANLANDSSPRPRPRRRAGRRRSHPS